MLRSLIICPDKELSVNLERSIAEIGNVGLTRPMDKYPTNMELTRFVRAHAPQVVFLSIESMSQALAIVATLEANTPGVQVVAIHSSCEQSVLLETMRSGIREFVASPFEQKALLECLCRVTEILEKKPVSVESTDLLYSFLPSKAGVGTSTLALNAAVAASKIDSTATFLADFDLSSGMIRFMLKLENSFSVIDAAQRCAEIDDQLWPQLVTKLGSLDVIHAGRLNPDVRLEAIQMREVLGFVRRNYKVICADLSGNFERYSIEIMHESKKIFLVCTPEISSLHLAREKYQYLQRLELGDRVAILVNRWQKRPVISAEQIEELLGLPVHMTFPNDYFGVYKALGAGQPIDATSDLGKQCAAFARTLVGKKASKAAEPKRRFAEYFSLSQAKV